MAFLADAIAAQQCPRGTVTGKVSQVRDGDTVEVGGMAIRLDGIAAPELDEPGGDEATTALRAIVLGRQVRCELNGERSRDRCVAVCYLNEVDVAEMVVLAGLARDCPRYSGGRYAEAERRAAAEGARIRRAYPLPGWCR